MAWMEEYFQVGWLKWVVSWLLFKTCKVKLWESNKLFVGWNIVRVRRAPEPTNVFWENLTITQTRKFLRWLLSSIITLACLGLAYGINFAVIAMGDGQGGDNLFLQLMATSIASVITIIVNWCFKKLVFKLAFFEVYDTYERNKQNYALRLSIALFINTGIIPLLTAIRKSGVDNWYNQEGLVIEVVLKTLLSAFFQPLTYIGYFAGMSMLWRCKIHKIEKSGGHHGMT